MSTVEGCIHFWPGFKLMLEYWGPLVVNVHEKEIQCVESKRNITPSEQIEKVASSYSADMTLSLQDSIGRRNHVHSWDALTIYRRPQLYTSLHNMRHSLKVLQ